MVSCCLTMFSLSLWERQWTSRIEQQKSEAPFVLFVKPGLSIVLHAKTFSVSGGWLRHDLGNWTPKPKQTIEVVGFCGLVERICYIIVHTYKPLLSGERGFLPSEDWLVCELAYWLTISFAINMHTLASATGLKAGEEANYCRCCGHALNLLLQKNIYIVPFGFAWRNLNQSIHGRLKRGSHCLR